MLVKRTLMASSRVVLPGVIPWFARPIPLLHLCKPMV
jgi:hypothetical protein